MEDVNKIIAWLVVIFFLIGALVASSFWLFSSNEIKSSKPIEPIIEITTSSVNGITESDTTYTYKL